MICCFSFIETSLPKIETHTLQVDVTFTFQCNPILNLKSVLKNPAQEQRTFTTPEQRVFVTPEKIGTLPNVPTPPGSAALTRRRDTSVYQQPTS